MSPQAGFFPEPITDPFPPMALHLVLGYTSPGSKSPCEPIYCGQDADEARAAIAAYDGHRTTWLRNPIGVTKLTARVAADRSGAQDEREIARLTSRPGEQVSAEEQLAAAEREIAKLRREIKNTRAPEAPASAPAAVTELALESETLPMVNSSDPAPGDSAAPVAGEEVPTEEPAELEDPETASRRQAAEEMAAAAEEIEAGGKKKKGK